MIRGCLTTAITWGLIGAVVLWVLGNPESVAALVGTFLDLVAAAADSLGRLVTSLVAEFDGLI